MKVKLDAIYQFQKKFDQEIYLFNEVDLHNIKQQLHLAMMAELMELCNEIRCFNYWSDKKRNDDAIVLNELADVLSFAISEGVEYYQIDEICELEIADVQPTNDKFIQVQKFLQLIDLFNKIHDQTSSVVFLKNVLELGLILGYDFATQIQAYKKKCEWVIKQQRIRYEEKRKHH